MIMEQCKHQIEWLLEGDPAIGFQTKRDIIDSDEKDIEKTRKEISRKGWGYKLLTLQDDSGMWGGGLYSPKWISTTYTLLLLRRFGIKANKNIETACNILINRGFYSDEGINFFGSLNHSETCVTGIVLSILSYFNIEDDRIERIANHLQAQQMHDGGWNCQSYNGATHSSFHTTINVLEGLREYQKNYEIKSSNLEKCQKKGSEFILIHNLFRSDRTGEIFDKRMTLFSFPPRWHYDIMRFLDYVQERAEHKDSRYEQAIQILKKKRTKDGYWKLQNNHPGKLFFKIEGAGKPSRWNTLRALRILKWWEES